METKEIGLWIGIGILTTIASKHVEKALTKKDMKNEFDR